MEMRYLRVGALRAEIQKLNQKIEEKFLDRKGFRVTRFERRALRTGFCLLKLCMWLSVSENVAMACVKSKVSEGE